MSVISVTTLLNHIVLRLNLVIINVDISCNRLYIMVFYPTIGSTYFVKTQTYVALFGPHELCLIFSGGICSELTSLSKPSRVWIMVGQLA